MSVESTVKELLNHRGSSSYGHQLSTFMRCLDDHGWEFIDDINAYSINDTFCSQVSGDELNVLHFQTYLGPYLIQSVFPRPEEVDGYVDAVAELAKLLGVKGCWDDHEVSYTLELCDQAKLHIKRGAAATKLLYEGLKNHRGEKPQPKPSLGGAVDKKRVAGFFNIQAVNEDSVVLAPDSSSSGMTSMPAEGSITVPLDKDVLDNLVAGDKIWMTCIQIDDAWQALNSGAVHPKGGANNQLFEHGFSSEMFQ